MKPIAVIDLGSNSVRMSVNSVTEDGKWKTLLKLRETVRLGQGMEDGFLRRDSMERVVAALIRFVEAAAALDCDIVATATQAVRIAKNREDFLSLVREKTGLEFKVLSGSEEARYSYIAVRDTLPIDSGVLFDTGGGSTEIILVKNRELVSSVSTPCGAVMLTERFAGRPQSELYDEVLSIIASAAPWLGEAKGFPLYGIGGSARTLGSLYERRTLKSDEINGLEISSAAIRRIYGRIAETPPEERAAIPGMDASRADVILAGLTPLKVMTDMLDSPKLILCAYGVKEGVFFERKNAIIKKEPTLNIVLVEPEIPQNTGNIARTCAAIGAALHLVKPLGFEISDRNLRRAGLDYWNLLDVHYYDSLDDFFARTVGGRYFYFTTKAPAAYCSAEYRVGDYLMFGKETKGLPEALLLASPERCVRIPMVAGARSLNLGNSVAVAAYEAMRRLGFPGLKEESAYFTEEK